MSGVVLTDERRDGDTADTSSPRDVSVLIVDDQAPFRAVARTVIQLAAGFAVGGEAASGEEAVEMAAASDIVVILLSTYRSDDLPSDAADCGAARYIHKEDFGPGILREIWADHTG